jgi:hypothetical protein
MTNALRGTDRSARDGPAGVPAQVFTGSGRPDQASRQVAVLAEKLGEPEAPTH